jgi:chaperone modulatory protein CbpM
MKIDVSEMVWLDDQGVCTAEQLIEVSGLSAQEFDELVTNSVIVPVDRVTTPPVFALHQITTARIARRLRDDFELDRHGLTLALTLMRRIEALEQELNKVRARFDVGSTHQDSKT